MTITVRIFLISLATLAILHAFLLRFYLYWQYAWLDVPMHLFGGIAAALGVYAARDLHVPFFARALHSGSVMALVLAIALLWEAFEFLGGISVMNGRFWNDTFLDLALGIFGGALGILIHKRLAQLEP